MCELFLIAASRGYSLVVVCGLLIAVASHYKAWAMEGGLSNCGTQA